MKLNATISLSPSQVKDIICKYLESQGIKGTSPENIIFIIKTVEKGPQMNPFTVTDLSEVLINNIKVGE